MIAPTKLIPSLWPEVLDRIINIFFFSTLLFVFLLFANAEDHFRIFMALFFSFLFVGIAFLMNWLTLEGARSAFIFGLISFGLGGITGASLILSFFVSSSVLSKDLISDEGILESKFRRNGLQVWSNGFWFTLWIIVWFITKLDVFLLAAASSVAFATADTWASEIGGHRVKGKTVLITTMKSVKPGTDGGISTAGTAASFGGALLIAIVFWLTEMEFSLFALIMVAVAGLTGSFVDSYLGAKLQGKLIEGPIKTIFTNQFSYVDNNLVNWMASGSASIAMLIFFAIIGS